MFDLEASIARTLSAGIDVWVSGPASAEQMATLERELRVSFPPSFRRFLLTAGALSIHESAVSGIIEGNPLSLGGGSLFGDTERFRELERFPEPLLVLQADEDAPYCLDTSVVSESGEMPVVCYQLNTSSARSVASSFEEWLNVFIFNAAV